MCGGDGGGGWVGGIAVENVSGQRIFAFGEAKAQFGEI